MSEFVCRDCEERPEEALLVNIFGTGELWARHGRYYCSTHFMARFGTAPVGEADATTREG